MELMYARNIGDKKYEETDHLGNVRFVFSDRKISTLIGGGAPGNFRADSVSYMDYNPFGMLLPGRNYNSNSYKFGFNGQEKDDEITGQTGSHLTAEYWEYDSRLCRRWNIDPIVKPHESPYATFANNPIWFIDPFGLDTISSNYTS